MHIIITTYVFIEVQICKLFAKLRIIINIIIGRYSSHIIFYIETHLGEYIVNPLNQKYQLILLKHVLFVDAVF